MKKIYAIFMVLSLLIGMLSGCKNSEQTINTSGTKVIKLMFWDDFKTSSDLMTLEYKKTIDEFNALGNGYKIEPITTTLADYDTKLNSLIAAGNMPDIFFCNPGPSMNTYVNSGRVMSLQSILDKDKEWYDSFTSGIFDRLIYKNEIMAIPTNFAAACVFYNKKIFKEIGAEVPKTWTEFLDVCEKAKKAGYAPITCSGVDSWCPSIIGSYICDRAGGPDNLKGIMEGTLKWTDKSYTLAGNKLAELGKKEYFQKTFLGDGNDQATANFYNGKAAMLIQGSWAIAQIKGASQEAVKNTSVFKFPAFDGGLQNGDRWIVKTDNLCVSKKTKNLEGCIKVLKAFTNERAQKATAEVAGKIPVNSKVKIDYSIAPPQLNDLVKCMENMTGNFGFYNESLKTTELGTEFDNTVLSILTGQKTPEQAFADLQKFSDTQ